MKIKQNFFSLSKIRICFNFNLIKFRFYVACKKLFFLSL